MFVLLCVRNAIWRFLLFTRSLSQSRPVSPGQRADSLLRDPDFLTTTLRISQSPGDTAEERRITEEELGSEGVVGIIVI